MLQITSETLQYHLVKKIAESNFETARYLSFLRVELFNCMLIKPLGVNGN